MKNEKKRLLKALKYLEKIYPLDLLENKTYEQFCNTYNTENFNVIDRLETNGLIEKNKQKILKISGIIRTTGQGIDEKISKKIKFPETDSKYVEIPIISQKGFEYLNGLKQRKTNNLLILLTIITLFIGILQFIN